MSDWISTTEPRSDDSRSGAELIHSDDAVCVNSGALAGVAATLVPQAMMSSAAARPGNLRCMIRSLLQHRPPARFDPDSGRAALVNSRPN